MSLPITSIRLNGDGSWTFSWASTGAAFYRVVQSGIVLATITTTSYTWHGQSFTKFPPPLEVTHENQPALSEQFVPWFLIQWYGEPTVQSYVVQQLVGTAWTTLAIVQETGQWVYTFSTVVLKDETTYKFQVIAVNAVNAQATPRPYQRYVVCPPTSPDGTIAVGYSNPNIVISAK